MKKQYQRWVSIMPSIAIVACLAFAQIGAADDVLRIATFKVDATPPVGSPLAYDPMKEVVMPLSARGVVLIGKEKPIVLCAVDWIGIANDGYEAWRSSLAEAAGTTPQRVSVHALHQHDAPICDFSAERLLGEHKLSGALFDVAFATRTIEKAAAAVREAAGQARPVTHIGTGQAKVSKVASNRRILGADGRVRAVRWTACRDPLLRAEPEGVIDPFVKVISFWNADTPLAVLSYYATHPQSYYRTGGANPDFPGIARHMRETALDGLMHIHFTGAGGNIGAGKYNDGATKYRQILADRLAQGMTDAWEATQKKPLSAEQVRWSVVPVAIPAAPHLDADQLQRQLADQQLDVVQRKEAARNLVWLRRCKAHDTIDLTCLRLGDACLLHLPGEAVVEYQLAAQKLRPDLFVAVAAYTDYAPGYICLEKHYEQGGYEASPGASLVAPTAERVLIPAFEKLLQTN